MLCLFICTNSHTCHEEELQSSVSQNGVWFTEDVSYFNISSLWQEKYRSDIASDIRGSYTEIYCIIAQILRTAFFQALRQKFLRLCICNSPNE